MGTEGLGLDFLKSYMEYYKFKYGDINYLTLESYFILGDGYHLVGEIETALSLYQKAHQGFVKTLGSNDVSSLYMSTKVAYLKAELGLVNETINSLQKDIPLLIKNLGENNYEVICAKFYLATAYYKIGNKVKSQNLLEKVLEYFNHDIYDNHQFKIEANNLYVNIKNKSI